MDNISSPDRFNFQSIDFQKHLLDRLKTATKTNNRVLYVVNEDRVIDIEILTGRAQWMKMLWKKFLSSPYEGKYVMTDRRGKEYLTRQFIRILSSKEAEEKKNYKKVNDFVKTVEMLNFTDITLQKRIDHLRNCTQCFGKLEKAIAFAEQFPKPEIPIETNDQLFHAKVDYLTFSYLENTLTDEAKVILMEKVSSDENLSFDRFIDQQQQAVACRIKEHYLMRPVDSREPQWKLIDFDKAARVINPDEEERLYGDREANYAFKGLEEAGYEEDLSLILKMKSEIFLIDKAFAELETGNLPPLFESPSPIQRQLELWQRCEYLKEKSDSYKKLYRDELKTIPSFDKKIERNFNAMLKEYEMLFGQIEERKGFSPSLDLLYLNDIEILESYFFTPSRLQKYDAKIIKNLSHEIQRTIDQKQVRPRLTEMRNRIKKDVIKVLERERGSREVNIEKAKAEVEKIKETYETSSERSRLLRQVVVEHLNPDVEIHERETLSEYLHRVQGQSRKEKLLMILVKLSLVNSMKGELDESEVNRFFQARKELSKIYPNLKDLQPEDLRKNKTLISLIEKGADEEELRLYFEPLLPYLRKETDELPGLSIPLITLKEIQEEEDLMTLLLASMDVIAGKTLNEEEVQRSVQARKRLAAIYPKLKEYQPKDFLTHSSLHSLMQMLEKRNPRLAPSLRYILDGIEAIDQSKEAAASLREREEEYINYPALLAEAKEERNRIIRLIDAVEEDKPDSLDEAIFLLSG